MDFYSLHLLVNQLAKHPQIHPNTEIQIEYEENTVYEDSIETTFTTEPVMSIAIEAGKLTFSTMNRENAVAR